MKVLILEDMSERHVEFKKRMLESRISDYEIVEDAETCIAKLQVNKYDLVFFDHDLGGETYVSTAEENTGSGVARWMVENQNNLQAQFVVHSLNHDGRKSILSILKSAGCECYEIPFVWLRQTFHMTFPKM